MIGIVAATFTLKHHGREMLTTPAYAFILQSRPGVLDRMMIDVGKNREQTLGILRMPKSIDAKPSASLKGLRKRLEASLRQCIAARRLNSTRLSMGVFRWSSVFLWGLLSTDGRDWRDSRSCIHSCSSCGPTGARRSKFEASRRATQHQVPR